MHTFSDCTHVTPECPVEATLYGYRPNLAVNTFFTVLFGIILVAQLALGIWTRTRSFLIFVCIGVLGELLGYIGRLLLNANPWSRPGLEINICCLVLAPTFLAGGVYLTLKHVVSYCGPQYSRLRPERYPWIFISCDLCSIIIQGIGGGIAASANTGGSPALLTAGADLIIAGIAFQVFTQFVFCCLALDYYHRRRKALAAEQDHEVAVKKPSEDSSERTGQPVVSHRRFQFFCVAMSFAYTTILIRCIYRIHEMAGGWGNPRMRDEATFLILDGMMIGFAAVAFTVAHPGIMFPPMRKGALFRKSAGNA